MKESISQMRRLAAGLKTALNAGSVCKEPATHGQCLELIAQAAGAPNWGAAQRLAWQGWVYQQHLPYLPNPLPTVQALATRHAVWTEVTAQATDDGEAFSEVRASMRRAFEQMASVLQGWGTPRANAAAGRLRAGAPALARALRVAAELTAALERSLSVDVAVLEAEAAAAFDHARGFAEEFCRAPLSPLNAERYQHLYLSWRLAQLSLALRLTLAARDDLRMGALLQRERPVDVYGLVALAATVTHQVQSMHVDNLAVTCAELRRDRPELRGAAKEALLDLLAHRSSDQQEGRHLADVAASLFPEAALWHAWVELKPLLASGVDEAYRDLARATPATSAAASALEARAQACTAAEDAALLANAPELARRLNAMAQGVRFHEEALRACLLMPDLSEQERLVLKRWLMGDTRSADHFRLQDLAIRVLDGCGR